jgi:3-hydroxy-9,10-secoandrosta-1,3,5(10)-triene-9,17-dione monooxygenase
VSLAEAPPAEGLVERAEALVPMLLEKAAETERARRVPDEHFDAVSEAGFFKMCAPKRFGGYEADFQTQCDALAALARGCPSTSWVATIFSAMGWLAGTFSDEAQNEIFATGDPRVSAVLSPTGGMSVRKNGGFVINGRWPFNTGCHGARWTILNTILQTEDGDGMPMFVVVPSGELTILDDWYASGMAGTGSNTVAVEDVFVPEHRANPLPPLIEGDHPENSNSDNPYFRLPLAPVLVVNAGGTPLGMAQGAYEAFLERLPGRAITFTDYTSQAEAPVTHLVVGEAALKVESAEAHVQRACAILDGYQGGTMPTETRVKSRAHISYAMGLAREVVDALFHASGASSIQSHVPIQRIQRDTQALSNHAIMHAPTTIELYGRVLCGLDPNTALY